MKNNNDYIHNTREMDDEVNIDIRKLLVTKTNNRFRRF